MAEGSVGAGTGTQAFEWKGGMGTSSRVARSYTVGVLVQSNFGGVLTMDGAPVGRISGNTPSRTREPETVVHDRGGDGRATHGPGT